MSRYGICDTLVLDNGGQYTLKKFKEGMQEYVIMHGLSAPIESLGNSESERAVQSCKRFSKKAQDPSIAMMEYSATPIRNEYSPAGLLMDRKINNILLAVPGNLVPNPSDLRLDKANVSDTDALFLDLHFSI